MSDQDFYDDEPDPGTSATLAAESVERAERPEGLPTLMPPAMLEKHRRRRADFWTFFGSDALGQLMNDAESLDPLAQARLMYQAAADLEEAFRLIVIPQGREAYEKWVKNASDEDLMKAYTWYLQEKQPGEA